MKDELKELNYALQSISDNIDLQMSVKTAENAKNFHNVLIELIAKYPDNKDMIEFIVFVNDRLETSHTITSDILLESIKSLIQQKQKLINRLVHEQEKKELIELKNEEIKKINKLSKPERIINIIIQHKHTLGVLLTTILIAIVFASLIVNPKETIDVLNIVKELKK